MFSSRLYIQYQNNGSRRDWGRPRNVPVWNVANFMKESEEYIENKAKENKRYKERYGTIGSWWTGYDKKEKDYDEIKAICARYEIGENCKYELALKIRQIALTTSSKGFSAVLNKWYFSLVFSEPKPTNEMREMKISEPKLP